MDTIIVDFPKDRYAGDAHSCCSAMGEAGVSRRKDRPDPSSSHTV
jgi:hypothetical protein